MFLGVATSLSSMFFETMLSTPAWISFWRCNPHAPGGATRTRHPFPLQLLQCSPHVPGRCLACVQRCHAGKRLSPVLALLLEGVLTVSHTRLTLPSRHASPGLGGGPTLALLRSFSQAEFTSPSPFWHLMVDDGCSSSFLTASVCNKIFRLSFRRIVQPSGVDDLCRLSSGLLQHDFRHFQLRNVCKFLICL